MLVDMSVRLHLVASTDYDVTAAQEIGHSTGVAVEQALPRFWYTVPTPVDLHELEQPTLHNIINATSCRLAAHSRWDPSLERKHTAFCLGISMYYVVLCGHVWHTCRLKTLPLVPPILRSP